MTWWRLIGVAVLCAVVGVVFGAVLGRISQQVTPATYQIGEVGFGTPSDHDIVLCPGEIIYYPHQDFWRCEP